MDANNEFSSTVDQFAQILSYLSPGMTPILGATLVGDIGLVSKLLAAGHDPNIGEPPKYGRVLDVAARIGNGPLCQVLIDGGAEVREKELVSAIGSGSLEAARVLLASYVTKCASGHGGTEVLYAAVTSGSVQIAGAVLDAPLGYQDKLDVQHAGKPYSPFGTAIEKDSPRVVKLLIERGADAGGNVVFRGDKIPCLHLACMTAGADVVRALIDAGADVNGDVNGEAAIHKVHTGVPDVNEIARQQGVLQVLVDRGADITAKNKAGRTIMQIVSRVEPLRQIISSAKTANSVDASILPVELQGRANLKKASVVSPL